MLLPIKHVDVQKALAPLMKKFAIHPDVTSGELYGLICAALCDAYRAGCEDFHAAIKENALGTPDQNPSV